MKKRARLLSLLLSVIMIISFMPAMVFAVPKIESKGSLATQSQGDIGLPEETEGKEWYVTNNWTSVPLYGGKATLTVETNLPSTVTPTYQWFWGEYKYDSAHDEGHYEYSKIEGEVGASYEATDINGLYACAVYSGEEIGIGYYSVLSEEYDWDLEYDYSVEFTYGTSPTLTVKTNYSGTDEISYQWFRTADIYSREYEQISGKTKNFLKISEEARYKCEVTINGQTQSAEIFALYNIDDYEWSVTYPNATATYTSVDPDGLVIDYINGDYYPDTNFPQNGDKVTIKNGSQTTDYIYDNQKREFVNQKDKDDELYVIIDNPNTDVDIDKGKVRLACCSTRRTYDHSKKKVILKYNTYSDSDATVLSNLNRISFTPVNSYLFSEDVKDIEDGKTVFGLWNRRKFVYSDGEEGSDWFLNGDKIALVGTTGTKHYTYKASPNERGSFVNDSDATDIIWPSIDGECYYLKPGNNTVKIWYCGKSTTFTIFLDTPKSEEAKEDADAKAKAEAEAKAKADAEAAAFAAAVENARQGVYDSSLPKVKVSKPLAKKTSMTAKWTKLTKKQLKKSKATNYEIWVCTNAGFAAGQTKEFIVGKGKSSKKINGLQKNTKYYVRVRAVKYVNGVKCVGKWSQKTIKTKKK